MIEKVPFSVNLNYFKGMVFEDPNWDFRTFDVDRDTRLAIRKTGKYVDANNPDLKPFKQAGGKIIMLSSWSATALPTREYVEYYEAVEKTMGGPARTRDFARMFTIPGSSGCSVFANPKATKIMDILEGWVEAGKAPDKIIYPYTKERGGPTYRTRPLCVYPKQARYKGNGDINDAANFTCVYPGK